MRQDTSSEADMKTMQIISWVTIAVNIASAGLYAWMINRVKRLRDRDKEALNAAITEVVEEMGPAVIFCAMMRDSDNVPDPIRKIAANAIPKSVTVHRGIVQGKQHVH
jgi:hypothetical protein